MTKFNVAFEFKQVVDIEYVYKLLCKLIIYKATGCDNIPPKMLKICAEELTATCDKLQYKVHLVHFS